MSITERLKHRIRQALDDNSASSELNAFLVGLYTGAQPTAVRSPAPLFDNSLVTGTALFTGGGVDAFGGSTLTPPVAGDYLATFQASYGHTGAYSGGTVANSMMVGLKVNGATPAGLVLNDYWGVQPAEHAGNVFYSPGVLVARLDGLVPTDTIGVMFGSIAVPTGTFEYQLIRRTLNLIQVG